MADAMKAMLAQKKAMTPKSGFNLVGLDDFERPGEQLFIISSHKTQAEAERAQKKHHAKNPDTQTFIYGAAKTESVADAMASLIDALEDS